MMNKNTVSIIEIHIATMLLGGIGLFAKLITLPVPVIIFGRTFIAFCFLYLATRLLSKSLKLANGKQLLTMVALGATSLLQWTFFFKAIQESTVSLAVVIFTSYPLFICFLEPWLNKERVKKTDILAAVVILAAVYIAAPGVSWNEESNRGVIFAVIAGFGQATNIVLKKRFASGTFPSLTISFYEHFFANLLLLPLLPFILVNVQNLDFSAKNIGLIVLLGVGFSALTRYLAAQSLINLNARTVGFIITIQPIYAIIFASALLNEVPSVYTLIGGAMIIAVVFVRKLLQAPPVLEPITTLVRPPEDQLMRI